MWNLLGNEVRLQKMDEDDLLYAIMAMDLILRSGASLETALEYVASHDYGIVSLEFKRVIAETHEGKYLDQALQDSARRVKNDLYGEMVRAMVRSIVTSAGAANTLRQIAIREAHIRRTKYRAFLESVHGVGEIFIILGALIPLILGVAGFTSDIMSSSELVQNPLVPTGVVHLGFVGVSAVLAVIVLYVKMIAPKV